MPAPLFNDARLAHLPSERWERVALIREHEWLRDVRLAPGGALASATCMGLVGVRVHIDRATLESQCDCGAARPCEHALALLAAVGIILPAPADGSLILALDASDPGRARLSRADGAPVPEPVIEVLRWLWWRREPDGALTGEVRTVAQALMHLAERALRPISGDIAAFRQRALGDVVHVHFEDPTTDVALALAKALADRGGRPLTGEVPSAWWTIDETPFGAWLLLSTQGRLPVDPSASVAERWAVPARADAALHARPLEGIGVDLDTGCLPARIRAPPQVTPHLTHALGGSKPALDDQHGHVLIPATRVVDVEDALRALGADVHYKRLAPAGERFLQWAPELPEDVRETARPRLREPFRGALDRRVPGLRPDVELAGYQEEAVAFILHHDHTCLLADEMGLGKTLEAVAAAQFLDGRILVVCPASAREVWRREVGKFTVESAEVLLPSMGAVSSQAEFAEGAEAPSDLAPSAHPVSKYVVVGYSNLEARAHDIDPSGFALVILDESHYVKNGATGRARAVREKLQGVPRRLVISGTPVMNAPEEIRAQLSFLHPDEWSDAAWFRRRFEEPFEEGAPDVRTQVLSRLRQFLGGVMLRREKTTALPDLPPKSILWHRVTLPPEAQRAYAALDDETIATLDPAKAAGKLERLKQAALAGKMPAAIAFIRSLVEPGDAGGEHSAGPAPLGDKVVVFSRYRDALASLTRELADLQPAVLTGETDPKGRAAAEKRFQEDPACRVFLGQLVAAGTAITLTAGTHAIFLDLDWNPANHRQAMDRIHRRGQTRPVTAHFFLAEGTVEEEIARVLDEKGEMMDQLLRPSSGGADIGTSKNATRLVAQRLIARRAEIAAVARETPEPHA